MDKMREEFEIWAKQFFKLDIEDWGEYVDSETHWAWLAWKASREALVVGVPENQPHSRYEDDLERGYTMGYNEAVLYFKERLTKAGVNYK